jgi:integrase
MILLGLNCGFGNADCAKLPLSAVDLDRGMVNWPRPKTGIDRRCPLWPETAAAVRVVMTRRREGRELVFETKRRNSFGKDSGCISKAFRKVLDAAGLYRRGRNFYSLRHVFRTVADATRDFPAVQLVMGHADASIDALHREQIDDARLRAVVDHVRAWLSPEVPAEKRLLMRPKSP